MIHVRTLKIIGVAVLTACALSVAVVTPASASTFLASAVGALVLGTQLGTQLFKIDPGSFECAKAASEGKTSALSSLTLVETVNYSGCKLLGSALTISQAEYELSADQTFSVLKTLVLTSTVGGCSIKVAPTGNQSLKSVLYLPDASNGNALIIKTEVKGISYSSSGGICGPTGTLTNGEYSGESLVVMSGGKISWDK